MTKKQNSNVPAIIVCILLFGMISFVTNLASPMGDVLKNQFGVPNWMGTLGVLCNFIAYAVMGIPAGNMLQNLGYKKTALIAVAVGFAGVGIQTIAGLLAGNAAFGVYLLGAFVAGFSMCMLNIVVNPMLNKLAGGGNKGNQLVQVGGSFNSLMGTAVIFLTGVFVPSIVDAKISQVFPLMGIALAIFAVAFIVVLFTNIPENAPAAAVKGEKFVCPVRDVYMDMMYMPDALRATVELMEADPAKLVHRNSFNIASMSFTPEIIAAEIKKHIPEFTMDYNVDPVKEQISRSWPNYLDDSCAREEWGWKPKWDLELTVTDMLDAIRYKLGHK